MARRKTLPDSVRTKYALAERLTELRKELFGERGGPELARRLGLPVRTWYNYEAGVTVPAEVILKLIEMTSVEPAWLLHGEAPQYRTSDSEAHRGDLVSARSANVLLRKALEILEEEAHTGLRGVPVADRSPFTGYQGAPDEASIDLVGAANATLVSCASQPSPRSMATTREPGDTEPEFRCLRVADDAMAPLAGEGAHVAYATAEESTEALDGKLVVVWLEAETLVRWFEVHGHHAILRAENAEAADPRRLIDLGAGNAITLRRVLWINTPH